MLAFVTVGTTRFDELIKAVDSKDFLEAISAKGCVRLSVQIGHGTYEPRFESGVAAGVVCDYFRFKPNLKSDMAEADLVISHAGAGSIMEALGLGKPLVVVVNDWLMHNHQEELATALAQRGHVVSAYPSTLASALAAADLTKLEPYVGAQPEAFAAVVNQEMSAGGWL